MSGGIDVSGLGGAVQSILGGIGGLQEASGLREARDLANKNADIEKLSTGIKLTQANRQAYQVLGTTEANAGANGIALSGSSMDVLKSNSQQLSLNKTLTEEQGQIYINAWKEKAAADEGAAQAALMSGIGGIIGGIGSLFSDERLKVILGKAGVCCPGINLYRFRFKGSNRVLRGVVAQEVLKVRPDAVSRHANGYLMVNYHMLGLAGMTDA